jgi:hypothetical protein
MRQTDTDQGDPVQPFHIDQESNVRRYPAEDPGTHRSALGVRARTTAEAAVSQDGIGEPMRKGVALRAGAGA